MSKHCAKGNDCGIIGNHIHPDEVGVQPGIAVGKPNANIDRIEDRVPREHGGSLCVLDHICPPCQQLQEQGYSPSPCVDLFEHPECGLVACNADERKSHG